VRFLGWTKIWHKTSQINPRDLRKMSTPASFSGQLNHRRLSIAAVGEARASFHDIPPPPNLVDDEREPHTHPLLLQVPPNILNALLQALPSSSNIQPRSPPPHGDHLIIPPILQGLDQARSRNVRFWVFAERRRLLQRLQAIAALAQRRRIVCCARTDRRRGEVG
jgi:hypothetical protein